MQLVDEWTQYTVNFIGIAAYTVFHDESHVCVWFDRHLRFVNVGKWTLSVFFSLLVYTFSMLNLINQYL